jgi:hypothetical protein
MVPPIPLQRCSTRIVFFKTASYTLYFYLHVVSLFSTNVTAGERYGMLVFYLDPIPGPHMRRCAEFVDTHM